VIGTGFAGAVTACRLTQAGLGICVLERGRRYGPDDLPVYPSALPEADESGAAADSPQPDLSAGLWKLGAGLWDVRDLGDVMVAQAAGYGGGSLIYANVHLRAPDEAFHGWPDEYRRRTLDPYYDLAAYMLGVQRMPPRLRPPKYHQLERAATELEKAGAAGLWHFDPPLAVAFPPPGSDPDRDEGLRPNRWKRDQGACDLRGDCCFGCPKQAKNTLDLNYLAIAEDAEEEGRPAPDIRTLAEVVSIERVASNGSFVYEVEYLDHLFGGRPVSVRGRVVFLCAGAVNTTELLLRCRQAGKLTIRTRELGGRYFPNADAVAAVFDCDELQEADRGPTISGALLYTRDSEDPQRGSRDWFLIEDGGMPSALEPLLGAFRSPLWAGRNRYREGPTSRSSKPGAPFYAELPFGHALDALSGLTRSAAQPGFSPLLAAGERLRSGRPKRAPDRKLSNLLPPQIDEALGSSWAELREALVVAAEPEVDRFMVQVAEKLEGHFDDLETLLGEAFPIEDLPIGDVRDLHLARRGLRLAVQLAWGSEGGLVEDLVTALGERLVPEGGALVDRVTDLLQRVLDYRLGDGHTAMVLSMGRDSHPGRLRLCLDPPPAGSRIRGMDSGATAALAGEPLVASGAWGDADAEGTLLLTDIQGSFKPDEPLALEGRLIGTAASPPAELKLVDAHDTRLAGVQALRFTTRLAELPTAPLRVELPRLLDTGERSVQERILRDIAAQGWDGELRTDPLWHFLGRRVTVHSQGGCPMPEVTQANGEVRDCPGLYVMDAAAFPESVGVNPSATIAAVAEYKVEQYIRTLPDRERWRAEEFDEARAWAEEPIGEEHGRARIRRDELDPIGALFEAHQGRVRSAPPAHRPVGIEFEERMTGFHAPPGQAPAASGDPDVAACQRAEREGIEASATIDTKLEVTIDDLARFLETHREACARGPGLGLFPRMEVVGCVVLCFGPDETRTECDVRGSIQLLDPTPGQGREERILSYELDLSLDGEPHVLHGRKYIRDDPGLDVWQDTSTLYFDLIRREAEQEVLVRCGILRLHVSEFLETQLQSFQATHTDDPARRAWALAAFGQYFLGNLVDVYLPERERVADVIRRVLGKTHG
jgi:choline dehydrogenase-like flavoprotein